MVVYLLILIGAQLLKHPVAINMVTPVAAMESYNMTEEVKPLPPGVEEIIRFNFKDLGETTVQQALRVFRCESGLRPAAVNDKNTNKTSDLGVAQINSVHKVPARFLKNPKVNIAVARQLYDEQGWTPWNSSKHCWGK